MYTVYIYIQISLIPDLLQDGNRIPLNIILILYV